MHSILRNSWCYGVVVLKATGVVCSCAVLSWRFNLEARYFRKALLGGSQDLAGVIVRGVPKLGYP